MAWPRNRRGSTRDRRKLIGNPTINSRNSVVVAATRPTGEEVTWRFSLPIKVRPSNPAVSLAPFFNIPGFETIGVSQTDDSGIFWTTTYDGTVGAIVVACPDLPGMISWTHGDVIGSTISVPAAE